MRAVRKCTGKYSVPFSISLLLLGVWLSGGCSWLEYVKKDKPPSDAELYSSYYQTVLQVSTSRDVLSAIHRPEYELLSYSTSVVASIGQKRKGRKIWFNMVAFDESSLTARRKYIFITDDRPNPMEEPRQDLIFDCEAVLDPAIFAKPYASETARRIAILEQVQKDVRKDVSEVGADNKMLDTCGMMVNQAFGAALVKLEGSPAAAWRLTEPGGAEFSHINLDRGRIQLTLKDNTVIVKMRLGRQVQMWEEALEEEQEDE
ncbi:MAG: hypothetical protein ACYS21_05780 [Planctomycetota bacterium]